MKISLYLFFGGSLTSPVPFQGSNHERDSFFLSCAGYKFDLHLTSSSLVKVKERVFIRSLPILLVVIEMAELVVKISEDIGIELGKISKEDWQLLFSRFLRRELEEIREIESIVSKSKLTEEQAKELADEVSLAVAKRLLEIEK